MSDSIDQRLISSKVILRALHDLQAPARHTQSFLALFRDSIDESTLSDESMEMLDAASRAADELREFFVAIRSSLAVPTSIESRQTVDLAVAVETAWKRIRSRAVESVAAPCSPNEAAAEWDAELSIDGDGSVESDEALVVAMLTELLDNAVRYVKPDEQPLIRCLITTTNTTTQIEIFDNGVGMDPRRIDLLKQPFHRGHVRSGLGLGLARCECIAQTLDSQWNLRSDGSNGTVATVTYHN